VLPSFKQPILKQQKQVLPSDPLAEAKKDSTQPPSPMSHIQLSRCSQKTEFVSLNIAQFFNSKVIPKVERKLINCFGRAKSVRKMVALTWYD
jgi:hypothetical protein